MPRQSGEKLLLTLFADVHYFFGPPDARPPKHRFDKRSYVYLYHEFARGHARLEVANNAGTQEQDAFAGSLSLVQMVYSYKQPVLVTIIVNTSANDEQLPAGGQSNPQQWQLLAFDTKNQRTHLCKLHSVDIYFWTENDASLFVNSARRVLADSQLRILDAAPISTTPAQNTNKGDAMSPVVQQLENVALSTPERTRTDSFSVHQPSTLPSSNSSDHPATRQSADQAVSYAPIPYNPAAPATPEHRVHREKTPPPPDAVDGTGLTAAARYEHGNQNIQPSSMPQNTYYTQSSMPPSQSYFPGSPQLVPPFPPPPPPLTTTGTPVQHQQISGSFPPPPPPAGIMESQPGQPYQQSFALPPQDPTVHPAGHSTPLQQQPSQRTSSYSVPFQTQQPQYAYASTPSQQQFATHPQSPGYGSSQTPGDNQTPSDVPLQSPGLPQVHSRPLMQSPPPPGYSYAQSQSQQPQPLSQHNAYNVHSQVYMPSEAEAGKHASKPVTAGPGQAPGRLEQRAERLEKGVNRFLKRLDKKF